MVGPLASRSCSKKGFQQACKEACVRWEKGVLLARGCGDGRQKGRRRQQSPDSAQNLVGYEAQESLATVQYRIAELFHTCEGATLQHSSRRRIALTNQ